MHPVSELYYWTRTWKSQQKEINGLKFYGKEKLLPYSHGWVARPIPSWVSPSLCFKARLSAKQVIWKSFLVWWRWTSLSQKGFALSLVLKVTVFGTWKWPIEQWAHDELHFGIPVEQNNPSHLKETRLITVHDNVLLQFTAARLITIYDNVQGFLCNNEFTAGHFIQLFSKLWPNFSPFRATFVSGIEIWSKDLP